MYKFLGNYDFDFTINLEDFKFRDNKVNQYDDSFDLESNAAIKAGYGENTNVQKCYYEDYPKYMIEYLKKFPIEMINSNFHYHKPGYFISPHRDHFRGIADKKNKTPYRICVFMNDWSFGQVLMIGNSVLSNWKKGDAWIWDSTELHMSSNGSLENKLTLIISGFINN